MQALGPLLIGLEGPVIAEHEYEWLQHPSVGGVVLFSRNYQTPEQLLALTSELRTLRNPSLLICIDQEGGRVQRLRESFTALPALRRLGQLYTEDPQRAADFAYRHGRVMASEMLAYGIDQSFAPVLDLDGVSSVIGDRAFSDQPQVTIELAKNYLAGMRDAGMAATGKHFPGHGSVFADSHTDEVIDERSLSDMQTRDMRPFIALHQELPALMIAHVIYPAVDKRPAGYSEIWLQQILRQDIGYRGVIMSDDLGMHAATTVGSLASRVRLSLAAGCDLVLICRPEDVAAYFAATAAVELPDVSAVIAQLYGKPSVARNQLAMVPEWRHWQASLEEINSA